MIPDFSIQARKAPNPLKFCHNEEVRLHVENLLEKANNETLSGKEHEMVIAYITENLLYRNAQ